MGMTLDERFRKVTHQFAWRHDSLFRMVAQYEGVLQEIIETTTGLTLDLVETNVQFAYENKPRHSIVLDARCRERNGAIWDVEIQNASTDDIMRRMRFYSSLITSCSLGENEDYSTIPNVGVIFITNFDYLKLGWSIYELGPTLIPRTTQEREQLEKHSELVAQRADMGMRFYLANATARDGSEAAKLMEELSTKDVVYPGEFPYVEHMKRDFLETKKGRQKMIQLLSDYEKDVYREGDHNGFKRGQASLEALLCALKDRLLPEGKQEELFRAMTDAEYRRELAKFYFPNGVPGVDGEDYDVLL